MKGFIASDCPTNKRVHTKVDNCSMFEGTPKGLIVHDTGVHYTPDEDTFNEEIQAGLTAAGIERVVPIMNGLTNMEVSGGDVKTNQEGFGPEMPYGLNAKIETYTLVDGGICQFKQLAKYNGQTVRLFKVDNTNKAYGVVNEVSKKDRFRGRLCRIYVTRRDNTGSQPGAILLYVYYDTDYENEEINIASIRLTEDLEGLSGVVLKRTDTGKAKFVTACSGVDLTSTYGATLGAPTLYEDKSGANPSTVTYDSVSGTLEFTPAAAKYRIADAEALIAANIEGYEGEDEYTDLT